MFFMAFAIIGLKCAFHSDFILSNERFNKVFDKDLIIYSEDIERIFRTYLKRI